MVIRCTWCGDTELYKFYHDKEWGVPVHDDKILFEFLCLEGAQAGLSWITILRKRAYYRKVYDDFDVQKIAQYDEAKNAELLQDAGIIRNKLKVAGFVKNAKAFIKVQEEFGSFDAYIWQFVNGVPIQNNFKTLEECPAVTVISDLMAKDLKKRGFTFVGSTICYAFMQAIGMVNDHTVDCFRHKEVLRLS